MQTYTVGNYKVDAETPEEAILLLAKQIKKTRGFKKDPRNGGGTFLVGYLLATYEDLVKKFGEPHELNGDKTLAEWSFISDDGVQFTIYDYKNYGNKKENIIEWHIGGKGTEAIKEMEKYFPTSKITFLK